MVKYETQRVFESALPEFAGSVRFTIRRQSAQRNVKLLQLTQNIRARLREVREIVAESLAGDTDAALLEEHRDEERNLVDQLAQACVRQGLVSVDGLELDGVAPDVELLISDGPPGLVLEISSRVQEEFGLLKARKKTRRRAPVCS